MLVAESLQLETCKSIWLPLLLLLPMVNVTKLLSLYLSHASNLFPSLFLYCYCLDSHCLSLGLLDYSSLLIGFYNSSLVLQRCCQVSFLFQLKNQIDAYFGNSKSVFTKLKLLSFKPQPLHSGNYWIYFKCNHFSTCIKDLYVYVYIQFTHMYIYVYS
jgi:hypothetical protein